MNKLYVRLGILLAAIALLASGASSAQEPEMIAIKFKLFDTNRPDDKDPIKPKGFALLSVRNKATKLPGFPLRIPITSLPDQFSQVEVEKNTLIEHLVIEAESTRYSPADVAKVVTRAPMTLYPGVSDSLDQFSFSAYSAQMNNYRAIITDLNTALPAQKDAIRELLGAQFKNQLTNMAAAAEDPKRLLTNDPEEIDAAKKLADEVLQLYGLRSADEKPPFQIICCHTVCNGQPSPATICVRVPKDAEIQFEGQPTESTGEFRRYFTPPLSVDRTLHYTISKVVNQNGKRVVTTARIPVRASCITEVDFR